MEIKFSYIEEPLPTRKNSQFPKVTIITATYNAGNYLEECISSVLNQSYDNIEYIVIDGGSTDSTINIIETYQHRLAYWISEPDAGIYDAWNKGISKATGNWLVFIGADDQLLPDAVRLYIEHIINHPNCENLQFVSSQIQLIDERSNYLETVGQPWRWELFRKSMVTWHVGTFHSCSLFRMYGVYDDTFKISGDYEFLLRAGSRLIASYMPSVTAKMRVGGISGSNLLKASQETYRAKIKNNVLSPITGRVLMVIDSVRLLFTKVTTPK
ncbi:glycosyltransferase family 2 protein [Fibrivirga algicola]|uniref:Glycosyltransferase n=1 Tax=Fibrivirga algicola TaxID=2950420 RepID=A0ABX0QHP9_9BACT|nr:glycosyltransferase family 2 protein [Fibrivirga algicola]NID11656.1 glycosyltransferase [Fibrivirga algicola]